MRSQDIERVLLGAVKELLDNPVYFYRSSVSPEYSHLTDLGKDVILETVTLLGSRLLTARTSEDIERSKQLVLDELKGK
jgi:hypothetical protein